MKPRRANRKNNTSVSGGNEKIEIINLMTEAMSLHQAGNLASAAQSYAKILKINPTHFDSLHLMGVIAVQQNYFQRGLQYIDQAISVNATVAVAYRNRATALKGLKQVEAAIASLDQAIKLQANFAEAYNDRGILLNAQNERVAANESFLAAIRYNPLLTQAYNNRGILLMAMAQAETTEKPEDTSTGDRLYGEALSCFNKAIALHPSYIEAFKSRGNVLSILKRYELAIESYDQAIALQPMDSEVFNYRGNAMNESLLFLEAVASYDKAISINPNYAEAYSNRGNALSHLGQQAEAIASYNLAVVLKPDSPQTYNNRGNAFAMLNKHHAAIADYDHAIKLKPDYAEAYYNCGNVFKTLRQLPVALVHYEKAIQFKPDYADAYANRASLSKDVGEIDFSIANWDAALRHQPDNCSWWVQRGNSLVTAGRHVEAIKSFEHAHDIEPAHDNLFGTLIHHKRHISDWTAAAFNQSDIERRVGAGEKCIVPFSLLSLAGNEQLQLVCARAFINNQIDGNTELGVIPGREKAQRIRVGYFSADFRNHPVAHLTAELFELHDRDRFEIVAFSMGPTVQDDMRLRLLKAFDHFIEIDSKTNQEVVLLAREMKIDIAVDMCGFTGGSRIGIFSMRAAPVQVSYLGYPSTLGANFIDYVIADRTIIPVESQQYFTEKVAYLPDTYMVNDSKRQISDRKFTREELGLPETGFVFCCFNNSYKVTPKTFDGWMRILQQVPGSVLWLAENNAISAANLRKEAGARNVSPDRLVFAKRMESLADHLARHRLADLFIDTLPFNAHTTASDALWAGLPVLTCIGTTFAGRVAASLLKAIELPELITSTQEDYEAMAVELATNPAKLLSIRLKLDNNRLTTALFDTRRFTKNIENIYTQMHENQHADVAVAHLNIVTV